MRVSDRTYAVDSDKRSRTWGLSFLGSNCGDFILQCRCFSCGRPKYVSEGDAKANLEKISQIGRKSSRQYLSLVFRREMRRWPTSQELFDFEMIKQTLQFMALSFYRGVGRWPTKEELFDIEMRMR